MSPTGSASNLTAFGSDIINNTNYGFKSTHGCGAVLIDGTAGIDSKSKQHPLIQPNPSTFAIRSPANARFTFRNAIGELIWTFYYTEGSEIHLTNFVPGVYFVEFESNQEMIVQKLNIY